MGNSTVTDRSSDGLLAAASLVLRGKGFTVGSSSAAGTGQQLLLAENDLFVIGLVEFASPDELPVLEGSATIELAEHLASAGAKRWDAYLVLLTSLPAGNQQMSATVTDILYNTRYVRRIIRWGLAADPDVVAVALRPFFPLSAVYGGTPASDPVRQLADRLPAHGVSSVEARAAVNLWLASSEGEQDVR